MPDQPPPRAQRPRSSTERPRRRGFFSGSGRHRVRRLPLSSCVRAERHAGEFRRARLRRQPLPALRQRQASVLRAAALRPDALALRDGRSRAAAARGSQRDLPLSCGTGGPKSRGAVQPAHRIPAAGRRRAEAVANTGPAGSCGATRLRPVPVAGQPSAATTRRRTARRSTAALSVGMGASRLQRRGLGRGGGRPRPRATARRFARASLRRSGRLAARTASIPPMEETALASRQCGAAGDRAEDGFIRARATRGARKTRATLLLDQAHTTNAYTVLETSGGVGSTARLRRSAERHAGQKGNRNEVDGKAIAGSRDEFRPEAASDGGSRRSGCAPTATCSSRSRPPTSRSASTTSRHFHRLSVPARARFDSDLPWLADMWDMNWNGARIGAFETYMDTPYYEQLQYVGDTRIQALISLYVSDDDGSCVRRSRTSTTRASPRGSRRAAIRPSWGSSSPPSRSSTSRWCTTTSCIATIRRSCAASSRHPRRPRLVRATHRLTGMLGPMPYWNFVDWAGAGRGASAGWRGRPLDRDPLLYAYALERAAARGGRSACRGWPAYRSARRRCARRAQRLGREARAVPRSPDSDAFSQQTNVLAMLTDAVPRRSSAALWSACSRTRRSRSRPTTSAGTCSRRCGRRDSPTSTSSSSRPGGRCSPSAYHGPGEPGADALGHARVERAPELRPARDGARRASRAPASARSHRAGLGPLQRAEGRVPHPQGRDRGEAGSDRPGRAARRGHAA